MHKLSKTEKLISLFNRESFNLAMGMTVRKLKEGRYYVEPNDWVFKLDLTTPNKPGVEFSHPGGKGVMTWDWALQTIKQAPDWYVNGAQLKAEAGY